MRNRHGQPALPRSVRTAVCVYWAMLRLYPASFRRAHGASMVQVFRDSHREVLAKRSMRALIVLWCSTGLDLASSAAKEHVMKTADAVRRNPAMFFMVIVALALAALTGWVDIHNTDVQPAAACVLVFSFLLAAIKPRLWWLWALLLGLSIPATHLCVRLFHITLSYPVNSYLSTFVALIPATIGAGLGLACGWIVSRMFPRGKPAQSTS